MDRTRQLTLFIAILGFSSLWIFAEDPKTQAESYDAIIAAPDNHRVVFENEKVRVLEVTIKPGEKEPFHMHPMPSVLNIVNGAKLRITEASIDDGKLVTGKSMEVGKDNLQPPPLWLPPEGLHSFENIGSIMFHAYRIELKGDEKPN